MRVRFPDDYVIQGTFGALDRLDQVYKFVKEHIFLQNRDFYLYETPPKKVINQMTANLKSLRMVPSGMLFFAWSDLEQTKYNDGPFLNMEMVRSKIITY